MRLDRRAWASLRDVRGFPEITKVFRPTIFVINTGRTFARHLNVVGRGQGYKPSQETKFAVEIEQVLKKRNPDIVSDVLLAPNAVVQTTLDQTPEGDEPTPVSTWTP